MQWRESAIPACQAKMGGGDMRTAQKTLLFWSCRYNSRRLGRPRLWLNTLRVRCTLVRRDCLTMLYPSGLGHLCHKLPKKARVLLRLCQAFLLTPWVSFRLLSGGLDSEECSANKLPWKFTDNQVPELATGRRSCPRGHREQSTWSRCPQW